MVVGSRMGRWIFGIVAINVPTGRFTSFSTAVIRRVGEVPE
ncbi:hypothetical protein PENNAL_c0788G04188, partial [Penicillium nalgiovense]